jgi:hypothetical protein
MPSLSQMIRGELSVAALVRRPYAKSPLILSIPMSVRYNSSGLFCRLGGSRRWITRAESILR